MKEGPKVGFTLQTGRKSERKLGFLALMIPKVVRIGMQMRKPQLAGNWKERVKTTASTKDCETLVVLVSNHSKEMCMMSLFLPVIWSISKTISTAPDLFISYLKILLHNLFMFVEAMIANTHPFVAKCPPKLFLWHSLWILKSPSFFYYNFFLWIPNYFYRCPWSKNVHHIPSLQITL